MAYTICSYVAALENDFVACSFRPPCADQDAIAPEIAIFMMGLSIVAAFGDNHAAFENNRTAIIVKVIPADNRERSAGNRRELAFALYGERMALAARDGRIARAIYLALAFKCNFRIAYTFNLKVFHAAVAVRVFEISDRYSRTVRNTYCRDTPPFTRIVAIYRHLVARKHCAGAVEPDVCRQVAIP